MKSFSRSLAMLVATSAVLPLLAYGLVSVRTLRTGTRQSVVQGTMNIATRAAAQIEQYVAHSIRILQSAGSEVHGTFLTRWQQERILRNYVLSFREYREITLYDRQGHPLASSRLARGPLRTLPDADAGPQALLSPIQIDDDLLPKASVTLPIRVPGEDAWWLVGELRLEEMWRVVDRIRVGERGYALLVDETGRLIAHGDPEQRARVARGADVLTHPLAPDRRSRTANRGSRWLEYPDENGRQMLGVSAPLPSLSWLLIIEQPTADAYGLARRLERLLLAASGFAVLVTILIGLSWGRSVIAPLGALMRGTEAIAEGRLDTRVKVRREDEFKRLGDAFNSMADRLTALQEETRKQERQAMFGRVAAGLVHDLSHPIQNIGNNCRLMLKMYDDPEYREMFRRTVERELQNVRRVLEDLRNLARPIPLERFPVDIGRSVGEVVESMRPLAEAAGLSLEYTGPEQPVAVEGDVFALGRVYRNLILNGIQATAPGGTVRVTAEHVNDRAQITVADTGCGIAMDRLNAVFDDFVTTKRRGLGLGLPIARKIVEQLNGTITVTSHVGRGTVFVIDFPALSQARSGTLADA